MVWLIEGRGPAAVPAVRAAEVGGGVLPALVGEGVEPLGVDPDVRVAGRGGDGCDGGGGWLEAEWGIESGGGR